MPTFRHGKSTVVLIDELDLTTFFRDATIGRIGELADATTFGATGKSFLVGLPDGRISLDGIFSGAANEIDAKLSSILAADALSVATIAPEGLTFGRRVASANIRELSYELSSPVTDVVSCTAELSSEGKIDSAHSLHALTAETATGNSASVDNLASSATGGVGTLHVTANTRDAGSILIKVQHSVDDAVFTDLITFTSVGFGVKTKERLEVAGTVNRYVRAQWTVTGGTTGSYTFHVNFARR